MMQTWLWVVIPVLARACHAHNHVWPRDNLDLPDGFSRRLFFDDFSGPAGSMPSPDRWKPDLGTSYPGGPESWGTGEVQVYTADPANVALTGSGTLKITPVFRDGKWTSSRIETTPPWDFACAAGQRLRVEARLKLGDDPEDSQQGIWPCFWALSAGIRERLRDVLRLGEIDIWETINGVPKIWHVVHCGEGEGGPCNEWDGLNRVVNVTRGQWHTVVWEVDRRSSPPGREESMNWFVDGQQTWSLPQSRVNDTDAWAALTGNHRMLLLNVAVGGGFPNAVARRKTPTERTRGGDGAGMEVDWVAVYAS